MLPAFLIIAVIGITQDVLAREAITSRNALNFRDIAIGNEEAAVFCCVLLLEGKSQEFDSYISEITEEERELLCRHMIHLDVIYHSGEITSNLLRINRTPEMISWAVQCSAWGNRFDLSSQYIKLAQIDAASYQEIATELLTIATSLGKSDMVLPLELEESIVTKILDSEYLRRRAVFFQEAEETAKRVGLSRDWAELLLGYHISGSGVIPDSEEELMQLLSDSSEIQDQFLLRFAFCASRETVGDKLPAKEQYKVLKVIVESTKGLESSRLGEMSYLASRFEDDEFIKSRLKSIASKPLNNRGNSAALLAAASERSLYEDIFNYITAVDELKHKEIIGISRFGHFASSSFWSKLEPEIQARILNHIRWKELCSPQSKR
ncbi:hypothetical protein SH449x_000430 [Pirellulaceae bacterium SH449]